jgi:hypothetical protein
MSTYHTLCVKKKSQILKIMNIVSKNYWMFGPPSSGKSYFINEAWPRAYHKFGNDFNFYNYEEGQSIFLTIDNKKDVTLDYLKLWADLQPFKILNGEMCILNIRPRILVTSLYHPSEIWEGEELNSIMERFVCVYTGCEEYEKERFTGKNMSYVKLQDLTYKLTEDELKHQQRFIKESNKLRNIQYFLNCDKKTDEGVKYCNGTWKQIEKAHTKETNDQIEKAYTKETNDQIEKAYTQINKIKKKIEESQTTDLNKLRKTPTKTTTPEKIEEYLRTCAICERNEYKMRYDIYDDNIEIQTKKFTSKQEYDNHIEGHYVLKKYDSIKKKLKFVKPVKNWILNHDGTYLNKNTSETLDLEDYTQRINQ